MKNVIKKVKNRNIFLIFLTFLCAMCVVGTILFQGQQNVKAAELIISGDLQQEYLVGSVFNVPSAQIQTDEGVFDANEHYVVFPDGRAYTKNSFELTQTGKYFICYSSNIQGKKISLEKSFAVYDKAAKVSEGAELNYLNQLEMTDKLIGGFNVSLPEGTTFNYLRTLDISTADLSEPITTIYPYSHTERTGIGTRGLESNAITIRLTDYYDETNYVEIDIVFNNNMNVLVRAGTNKERAIGFVKANSVGTWWRYFTYEGQLYSALYHAHDYSYGVTAGTINKEGNSPVEIYFDYITNKVYSKMYDAQGKAQTNFVADISSALAYDEPFNGFTTGEVKFSVYAKYYHESSVNFEISSIYGIDDLSHTFAYETTAPNIKVDFSNEKYGEVVVAKGEKVYLPKYTTTDASGVRESFTKVYYSYGTSSQTSVGVVNGTFTPQYIGIYTIVYGAYDTYGNYAEKTLKVNSVNLGAKTSLHLSFENDGDFELDQTVVTDLLAGKTYKLPTANIDNANAFDVDFSVYVICDKDGRVTKINKNELVLTEFGKHTLVYEYSDLFQGKVTKFLFNAKSSDEVVLESEPALPKYFIKGAKYSLDKFSVKTFNNNQINIVDPDVYAIFDDGETVKIDYNSFTISGSENVKLRYVYGDKILYESELLQIVDVNYTGALSMDKYFVGNFTKLAQSNKIEFTSNINSGDNTLEFINPISFANFETAFEMLESESNFEYVTFTFIDFYDESNVLKLHFNNGELGAYYSVNEQECSVTTPFYGKNSIYYDSEWNSFRTSDGKSLAWENKFKQDKVYLSITLNNISGVSKFNLSKINGQQVSKSKTDSVVANFNVLDVGGVLEVGSTIKVYKPSIVDVLTPYLNKNLRVSISIDGQYCETVDKKQVKLMSFDDDYIELTVPSFGVYQIVYSYTDAFDNFDSRTQFVYVDDSIAPQITLSDNYSESTKIKVKLNDMVKVADYTVTDSVSFSENISVKVILIAPNNEIIRKLTDNKFEATKYGEYKVYYYCTDEAGNYTSTYYTVVVE